MAELKYICYVNAMLHLHKYLKIMARIKRGILGGFSKKIGNIVGSSWKGIAVMKSLPLSVANPNTGLQQGVRTQFAAAIAFASDLLPIFIKKVWNRGAMQMSGFNAFVQANKASAWERGGSFVPVGLNISPSKENPALDEGSMASATSQSITLEWNPAKTGNQLDTDNLVALIVDSNGVLLAKSAFVVARSIGTLTISSFYLLTPGENIILYYFFQSADGFRTFGQTLVAITVQS